MQVLRIVAPSAMALFAAAVLSSGAVATRPPAKKAPVTAVKKAPARPAPAPSRSRTVTSASARAKTPVRGKAAPVPRSGRNVRRAPVRRYYQTAPTPERYMDIQQALASRGHFTGEANGTWGTDSIDALKRFQKEQNLAPSGKLDSLTLIALGLGPKRNLAAGTVPDLNTQPRPQDDNRRSQGSERP